MDNWQGLLKEKQFNDIIIEWNKKINLVSRKKKDVFDLIEDSKLFISAIDLKKGINILDLGTGGGFPGIVIAIYHHEINLTLIDSIKKKIYVVNDVVKKLDLKNVDVICARVEELSSRPEHKNKYDYIVARSVAVLQDLCRWSKDLLKGGGKLITLKGGEISGEIKAAEKLKFINQVNVFEKNNRKMVSVLFR